MGQSQGLDGFPAFSLGFRAREVCIGVAVAIAIILVATACAPDLGTPPQIAPAASYETARSFTAPTSAWPDEAWWKAYNDPVLNQLVDEAVAGSPDLKIAEARLREADAAQEQAGSALWPTLTASGSVQPTRESLNQGFPSAFQSFLHMAGTRRERSKAISNTNSIFSARTRRRSRRPLRSRRRPPWMWPKRASRSQRRSRTPTPNLMRLSADRDAAVEALHVRNESAALIDDRVKQQLENVGEANQEKSRVASAKADLDAIDSQIAHARDEIAALLGKGPDRGLDIALPKGVTLKAFGLPPALAVDLVGRRPDVVAARLRAEAAASRIDVAHADYYPNIDLSGFYGVQSLGLSTLLQKASIAGEIGPAVHLPVFDGGKIESGYRNARAEYDKSVATYDRTLTHALQDVADAAADERALAQQLQHARMALAESENAYRIAKLRYSGGLSRYLDVLTAEDTLVTLKRQVADLEAQAFAQDVALVRALGGGFVIKS